MSQQLYITRSQAFDFGYPPETTSIEVQGQTVAIVEMTDAQRYALSGLCRAYRVSFDPNHYRAQFDLPPGYVAGWLGGDQSTIYVGVAPDGQVSS